MSAVRDASELHDRFTGCMVGQAVGDALGFLFEGHPARTCGSYAARAAEEREIPGYRRGPFGPGQYSDDTQLARELVLSLVERERFDPADYARRIAELFVENRIVGRGAATTAAALRLAAGVPWNESGTPPPAAGNGTAMRAAPVGLLFGTDVETMIEVASVQGRITHLDPRCTAGSIAIAGATALFVHQRTEDTAAIAGMLARWTRAHDPVLAEALGELPRWCELPPDRAVVEIAAVGRDPQVTDDWDGISPFVTSTVLWSLYSVLQSRGDYWQAVCTAVGVGGDVDTTGAIAGALAGARGGLSAIPPDAARQVHDRGTWDRDELVDLAGRLHALHARWRTTS